jgi:ABC-type uncharacterized transport system auxiliary subunit
MNKKMVILLCCALPALVLCGGCAKIPVKQYYVLNYVPSVQNKIEGQTAFPVILRLKDMDIEDAYGRPQIVYRQSPYELRYYTYKLWAVKPARMVTDLVQKHIASANLVNRTIRRYDEGVEPNYELSGTIEALEEYDSDQLWFAHLAMRLTLTRLSDGKVLYSEQFDNRKKVYQFTAESVVQELSVILEYVMNQANGKMRDVFSHEFGDTAVLVPGRDSTIDSQKK